MGLKQKLRGYVLNTAWQWLLEELRKYGRGLQHGFKQTLEGVHLIPKSLKKSTQRAKRSRELRRRLRKKG